MELVVNDSEICIFSEMEGIERHFVLDTSVALRRLELGRWCFTILIHKFFENSLGRSHDSWRSSFLGQPTVWSSPGY